MEPRYTPKYYEDSKAFIIYAKDDFEKWKALEGKEISHDLRGKGVIEEVYLDPKNGKTYLTIRFDCPDEDGDSLLTANTTLFGRGNYRIDLNEMAEKLDPIKEVFREIDLKEFEKKKEVYLKQVQEKEEQDAKIEFEVLKEKYHCETFPDKSVLSNLYLILQKAENQLVISDEDIEWLKQNRCWGAVAMILEPIAIANDKFWEKIDICKFWRSAHLYEKSIEFAETIQPKNVNEEAALLTVIGATYRAWGLYDQAVFFGKKAYRLHPEKFYACSLLGATFYQKGDFQISAKWFDKAVENGATPKQIQDEITHNNSGNRAENLKKIASALFEINPERFVWAKYYLDKS